ncbi:MAG: hypothetical protein JXA54_03870 [Candidatus Heimdallarchaeota archaeon]|nr:hypothetical protein [Candidatus Heimdallarchaeota archaeon]
MNEKKAYAIDKLGFQLKLYFFAIVLGVITLTIFFIVFIIIGSLVDYMRAFSYTSIFLLIPIPLFVIIYIKRSPNYHSYIKIRALLETKDEVELIKIVESNERNYSLLALFALYDLQSPEFQSILARFQPSASIQLYFNLLLEQIHKDKLQEEVVIDEQFPERIPYAKVYYLDSMPDNQLCMVSKLPLDFYKDSILACPFCGNMAQRDSLLQWLENRHICPICKRQLIASDCLMIDMKRT